MKYISLYDYILNLLPYKFVKVEKTALVSVIRVVLHVGPLKISRFLEPRLYTLLYAFFHNGRFYNTKNSKWANYSIEREFTLKYSFYI